MERTNDYSRKNFILQKKVNILFAIIMLSVIILVVWLFAIKKFKIQNIVPNSGNVTIKCLTKIGSGLITFDSNSKPSFCAFKGQVIECTKDGIRFFDKNLKETRFIEYSFTNPVVKKSEFGLLVFDIDGKNAVVVKDKKIIWKKNTESNIIYGDINDSGYVSLVLEDKVSKSVVNILDKSGRDIMMSGKGESFVLSAKVAISSKFIIINKVDTSGTVPNTSFEFLNIAGEVSSVKNYGSVIYPFVWCLNNDFTVAVNKNTLIALDKNGKEKWKNEYTRGILSSYPIFNRFIVIAITGDDDGNMEFSSRSQIKVIDENGKNYSSCTIGSKAKNIFVYEDLIGADCGGKLYIINSKGKIISENLTKEDNISYDFIDKSSILVVEKDCAYAAYIDYR